MQTLKTFMLATILFLGLVATPLAVTASSHNPARPATISIMDQMPTATPPPLPANGPVDCSGGC